MKINEKLHGFDLLPSLIMVEESDMCLNKQMITDYQWIDDNSDLEQLILSIKDSDEVAFDSEFERINTFYPKPALFQLHFDDRYYLIDMKEISNHGIFLTLLNRVILHSGSEDLEILYNMNQALPAEIFDTQIAASLCGYGLHFSYQNIVKELLGVELSKAHSRSDWMQRPLSSAQIQYALDDVVYLRDLKNILSDQLQKLKRQEWYELLIQQRSQAVIGAQHVDKTFVKMVKSNRLNDQQQKLLWSLLQWREKLAQKRDKPRQWIIKNDQLVAIAMNKPQSTSALLEMGLFAKFVKYNEEAIFALYQSANTLDKKDLPIVDQLSPHQANAFSQAKQQLQKRCQALDIPSAVVINNGDLKALIAGNNSLDDLDMWRLITE